MRSESSHGKANSAEREASRNHLRRRGRSLAVAATLLSIVIALLGSVSVTPFGQALEEEIGLAWLFRLRGPRPPPHDVAVISIDRESSRRLGLPNKPDEWPRQLHARLVRALAERGAAVIAFDIIFDEPRNPADDASFARAIQEAGNVILFENLKVDEVEVREQPALPRMGFIEQRVPPIPALAEAAYGLGPFPLPKVPARVSQFWAFKQGAGDAPSLPLVALQAYALPVYQDLVDLLRGLDPEAAERLPPSAAVTRREWPADSVASALHQTFRADPQLHARLTAAVARAGPTDPSRAGLLTALIDAYGGPDAYFLNYYGPPQSVITIPYYRLLQEGGSSAQTAQQLEGKAVFVGYSEQFQPEQKDGFYTVFSQDTGLDLSGVEIASTAFANLLERRPLRYLTAGYELLLVAIWGALMGTLVLVGPGLLILPLALLAGVLYAAIALYLFAAHDYWLPIVTPVAFQLPVAAIAAVLWKYQRVRQERQYIRKALSYHLPAQAVDELARGFIDLRGQADQLFGICLATDAQRYTTLSERLEPEALYRLMNSYFEALFAPVRRLGGTVSDVVGDAALAFWADSHPSNELRAKACRAALELAKAVEVFNQRHPENALPTRIGVHCGEVLVGHVGALDHYEYRVLGDIVNTATRIEGLNKYLGTWILASEEVITGLQDIATRPMGRFLLAGKSRAISIFELRSTEAALDSGRGESLALFRAALDAFAAGHLTEAQRLFREHVQLVGEDGPSRFYIELCHRYLTEFAVADWDGVVRLTEK